MYIQFVERFRARSGYLAQLAGPDEREVLTHETLDGLKLEVLAVVDDTDTNRVECIFSAMAAKERAAAMKQCVNPN